MSLRRSGISDEDIQHQRNISQEHSQRRWSLRIAVVCVVLIVIVLAAAFVFLFLLVWLFPKEDFGTRRVCV